jgi:cytoskeletal protein CcmA (bactofilin family)
VSRRVAVAVLGIALLAAAPARAADIGPDDEVVITGTVNVPRGKHVDRVWIVDGVVNVAGHSDGSIVALRAPVRISGTVDGDVIGIAKPITLTRSAQVNGDIVYADERPAIPKGAIVYGDVRHIDASDLSLPFGTLALIHVAIWVAVTASSLVLGLLLLLAAPRAADAIFETARSAVWPAIGWGAALFFGLPVAAVVALVTLVGIPLGVLLLLALLPLWALGYVTSDWLLGNAVLRDPGRRRVAKFLAGWSILRAIAFIPFLGAPVAFGATVLGLGVLAVALWRARSPTPAPGTA